VNGCPSVLQRTTASRARLKVEAAVHGYLGVRAVKESGQTRSSPREARSHATARLVDVPRPPNAGRYTLRLPSSRLDSGTRADVEGVAEEELKDHLRAETEHGLSALCLGNPKDRSAT
jgi:hypothetical protein